MFMLLRRKAIFVFVIGLPVDGEVVGEDVLFFAHFEMLVLMHLRLSPSPNVGVGARVEFVHHIL